MTYSRMGAVNVHDELVQDGASCTTEKESAQKTAVMGCVRRTEEPPRGAPSDQSWDSLNKKLNNIDIT